MCACLTVDTAFLSELESEEFPPNLVAPSPVYVEVTGDVEELAIVILGRPARDVGENGVDDSMSTGDHVLWAAAL